ncbi:hypothetical protein [Burkholderia pyrrocinia]|uniref:hypothetical protein n=1 Tax=Burkholderia pyrrocinia TaxID=60550 RepID=UPI001BCBADED|nr:hypothetical protein [Burkholderia pyrrocinia]QVN18747.1 hypothetical protein JYG32_03150 [Burkholderia pyrrocinia]
MDHETEARLTALETIFIELAKRNSSIRDDLEALIGEQYRAAVQRSQQRASGGFQTGVLCDPKPFVDREAAAALANAYRSLADKLGWSI